MPRRITLNFSAGANLMLLLLEAQEGNWDEVDLMIRAFQGATMALKYADVPVVVAPAGLALGGGCEIALHADRVKAEPFDVGRAPRGDHQPLGFELMIRGEPVPAGGLPEIEGDAGPLLVHPAQAVLGGREALLGRASVPAQRLGIVPGHAGAAPRPGVGPARFGG